MILHYELRNHDKTFKFCHMFVFGGPTSGILIPLPFNTQFLLFADDLQILSDILSSEDSEILQKSLNDLYS